VTKFLTVLTTFLLLCASPAGAQGKPFKKALVLGGGGITPGVALGIIAGVQSAGYHPDVIIVSCGASLGAGIYSSFPDVPSALAFAKSEKFYSSFKDMVKIDSRFIFGLKSKLDRAWERPDAIPYVFTNNILRIPETIGTILPGEKFPDSPTKAKLIILGAQTSYGPEYQGRKFGKGALIRETYFTDQDTAAILKNHSSHIQKLFPYSRVFSKTLAVSSVSLSQAVRVSITDPFYINPAKINGQYFFGGAVDLFPIETAQDLADEVLANFPAGLYSGYEDLAISSVFGFAQSDRVMEAAKHRDVKWVDTTGTQDVAMDPVILGPMFVNKIPSDFKQFESMIDRQFRLGYERGVEAVKVQKSRNNVRSHLRSTVVGVK
jgi:hypothetical protein